MDLLTAVTKKIYREKKYVSQVDTQIGVPTGDLKANGDFISTFLAPVLYMQDFRPLSVSHSRDTLLCLSRGFPFDVSNPVSTDVFESVSYTYILGLMIK